MCLHGEAAAKINSILQPLHQGMTVFELKLSMLVLSRLDKLNRFLQVKNKTISGIFKAVENLMKDIKCIRLEEQHNIFINVTNCLIKDKDLQPNSQKIVRFILS